MIRLHIIAEGQTEEAFVKRVLRDYLGMFNIVTDVRCVETSRSSGRIYRGGVIDYGRVKRDIMRWMREDRNSDACFTTMFDLFRLPGDFPRFAEAMKYKNPYERVSEIERAFKENIGDYRFVPYIQLHEFEALILSDPSKFDVEFVDRDKAVRNLVKMCSGFASPELIDDGPETAPSKRIIKELPEYKGRKPSAGPRIAREIGIEVLRKKCSHFREWLHKLEALANG